MKKINISEFEKNTDKKTWEKKVWFVAIIWRPNAWKSTFLNTLIGEKISITSDVPQTTRNKIVAIYNTDTLQVIFLDTPWIHTSEKEFNEQIVSRAKSAMSEADLILHFIDGSRVHWEEENYLQEIVSTLQKPVLSVLTKSDLKQKNKLSGGEELIKISSETWLWFDLLIQAIEKHLILWPQLYPEDIYTQQELFFRISEIIREKAFFYAKEELPHSIYVQVEDVVDEEKIFRISSYIYVETESQKYIMIWKEWSLIKKIWTESRIDLEKILWKKVFLTVRVKVRKNWRKDENFIKKLLK